MDKLITNHAYLFIKQGLGEIQRGNTAFPPFNLQSVIKQDTAARAETALLCLSRLPAAPPAASSRRQGAGLRRPPGCWDGPRVVFA